MFGKYSNPDLNKKVIKNKIDQLKVWSWLMETDINKEDFFSNTMRKNDNNPGCRIFKIHNWWLLSDYGSEIFNRINIIKAVQLKFKIEEQESLHLIYYLFINKSKNIKYVKSKNTYSENDKTAFEEKIEIRFIPKKNNFKLIYPKQDLDYWQQYYISKENLQEDYTYIVDTIILNKNNKKRLINPNDNCYAYTFQSLNVKLYQPFSEKYKWLSTTNEYDIGGLTFPMYPSTDLYICKSYKDGRINANLGFNTRWIQSEMINIPNKFIKKWINQYKRIFIFFDNDRPGIKASLKLAKDLNEKYNTTIFYPLWLPVYYLKYENIKDNGEFIKEYGKCKLKKKIYAIRDRCKLA